MRGFYLAGLEEAGNSLSLAIAIPVHAIDPVHVGRLLKSTEAGNSRIHADH